MADYCNSADVKAWLAQGGVNLDDLESLIDLCIPGATEWINGETHRKFDLDTEPTPRLFDVGEDGLVTVDDIGDPAVTVATDTAGDGTYATAWQTSDFQVLPVNPIVNGAPGPWWQLAAVGSQAFPRVQGRRSGLVRVTARWGWPAVHGGIRLASIMQTARLVNRRLSIGGVQGFNDFGPVRIQITDADIDDLLQPYRLVTIG